jgi:Tfp pilus assembly protein PilZ
MSAPPDILELTLSYESPSAAADAFAKELGLGAVFIPNTDFDEVPEAGTKVRLLLRFPFSGGELSLSGEIVTVLPRGIRSAGGTPGVSVAVADPEPELRRRIEAETGLELPEVEEPPRHFLSADPRFAARTPVTLEHEGRRFTAETLDISCNGLLALLPGIDLSEGTTLHITVDHPRGGPPLEIDGRVANATRCDHGVMAHGIQFQFSLDRIDEVGQFVDDLSGHERARALATIAGSLRDNPLEDIIETFSSSCPIGTLRLVNGAEEGKIVYRDDTIVSVTCGLVSGAKALGRMFGWRDASFEFESEAEALDVADAPLPLTSVVLTASVERDELARLDLGSLTDETTFGVDTDLLASLEATLDDLARDLVANVEMGFPVGALIDILPISDALFYQKLAELIEAGIVRAEA